MVQHHTSVSYHTVHVHQSVSYNTIPQSVSYNTIPQSVSYNTIHQSVSYNKGGREGVTVGLHTKYTFYFNNNMHED